MSPPARFRSEGMTLVELAVVLAVVGGLGAVGYQQLMKLRMRVKAIEVKVLVQELDHSFDSFVSENGLSIPVVADGVRLDDYERTARSHARNVPEVPEIRSITFDYRLGSSTDYWKLTVLEKDRGDAGYIMTCGYQYSSKGAVEVNAVSPWSDYLLPTCLVADKPRRH